jgi:hypothetical protein
MSRPYKLPLRITTYAESVRIEDAVGRKIHLYFENDARLRSENKRWTEDEAIAIAKQIARALTDAAS